MLALRQSTATFAHGTALKVVFIAVAFIDLLLTMSAVQQGFVEMNPIMVRALGNPLELVMLKVMAPVFIAWLAPDKLLIPSIGLLMAVTGWNMAQLMGGL